MEGSHENTKENMEAEVKTFRFEIMQKLENSKALYKAIGEGSDKYELMIAQAANPFFDFEGREILFKDQKIGRISINGPFPQCVYTKSGHMRCGFFFRLETEITAPGLTEDQAKDIVLSELGTLRLDLIEIQELSPEQPDGSRVIKSSFLDTSEFLEQDK